MGRCLQLQFLSYYYSDLEPIAGCCRYVPFYRDLQVSIDGHPGDSGVNLETFAGFYLTLSVELGFIVCFLAVAQWLAFATRDRKVASSIPDRGIPRNNLG